MEKYIVPSLFVGLVILLAVLVDQSRQKKQETRVAVLSILLAITILYGGYHSYDTFYLKPQMNRALLAEFLQIPVSEL